MSRHTRENMLRALKIYKNEGPSAASRITGIPKTTIVKNAQRNGIEPKRMERTKAAIETNKLNGELTRVEVSKLAIVGSKKALQLILKRLDSEGHDISLKDVAVIFGILADKHMAMNQDKSTDHNAVDSWLRHVTGGDADADTTA